MRILDECLDITREIKEIEIEIWELRTAEKSPKSQNITGMPKGGGYAGNRADDYMVRLERKEEKKRKKLAKRDSLWNEAVKLFQDKKIKSEYIELMRYRFCCGLQWKHCCALMCRKYEGQNWNINKVFRVYRQIIRKCR